MSEGAAEGALPVTQSHIPSSDTLQITSSIPSPLPIASVSPVTPNSSTVTKMPHVVTEAPAMSSTQSQLATAKANHVTTSGVSNSLVPATAGTVERAVAVPVRPSAPSVEPSMISSTAFGAGNGLVPTPAVLKQQTTPPGASDQPSQPLEKAALNQSNAVSNIQWDPNGTLGKPDVKENDAVVAGEHQEGKGKPVGAGADTDINVLIARQLRAQQNAMISKSVVQQQQQGVGSNDTSTETMAVDEKEKKREKRALPTNSAQQQTQSEGSVERKDGSDLKRRRTSDESNNPAVSAKVPNGARSAKEKPASNVKAQSSSTSDSGPSNGSAKPSLRAVPAPGLGSLLPMLRSSPVQAAAAQNARGKAQATPLPSEINNANANPDNVTGDSAGSEADGNQDTMQVDAKEQDKAWEYAEKPRKKKTVSWAPEEKLVSVEYIDTRLELVKSWDPEFQITLPFAPATLQVFKTMSEQERADGEVALVARKMGAVSSFEAARKKEHDMELERVRKAREELQEKLNKMKPKMEWVRPVAIVLPTECRVEPDSVRDFCIVEDNYKTVASRRRPEDTTPPSPPPELCEPVDPNRNEDDHVRLFPLADGSNTPCDDGSANEASRDIETSTGFSQNYNEGIRPPSTAYAGNEAPQPQLQDGPNNAPAPSYGMPPQGGQGSGQSDGVGHYGGMNSGMNRQFAPNTMQHLLSALQNSGLLTRTNNNNNSGAPGAVHHGDNDGRSESFGPNAGSDEGGQDHGRNESYLEEDRRRQHEETNLNGGMMGQMGGGYGQQSGMMEGFPYGMAAMGPPPMGMPPPNMMMAMGMGMGPVGMGMGFGVGVGGMNGGQNERERKKNRQVETITRPKSKGGKQRKKCKYFGTKQGCRDGSSCVFAHN